MLNINKKVLITLVSAGLMTGAYAKNFGGKHSPKKAHHMGSPMHIFKRLDLTDAQKSQIKAIFKAVKPKIAPLNKQLKPLHGQLKTLSQASVYDPDAVTNVITQIVTLKKTRMEIMTKARNQAWNLLTPEQKKKAMKIEEKRKQKNKKRKQKPQQKQQNHAKRKSEKQSN